MNDKQLKKAIEHEMGCKTEGEKDDFSLKTKKLEKRICSLYHSMKRI